jgi:phospholipid/cholesterol/gamma-HCH transport system ATP-binding protein
MIEFNNVTKIFNDEVVLTDLSFRINQGETKIIIGESGCGKSTILKLILGLIKPDSGSIRINGQDISQMSERNLVAIRSRIGMVFQEGALFDSLSVRDNVGYRLYEEGLKNDNEIDEDVAELLGFVGLEDAINKMPAQLSGGMKRRVGIARALAGKPQIVLYDEPTSGLDPITKRTIVELMIKLRDLEGVTTVFVTHDLPAAVMISSQYAAAASDGTISLKEGSEASSRIKVSYIMLHEAKICFEGNLRQLLESREPYIRNFVE